MKFLIPISLFFFGVVCLSVPYILLLKVNQMPSMSELFSVGGFLAVLFPILLGLSFIGLGVVFSFKCYSEK